MFPPLPPRKAPENVKTISVPASMEKVVDLPTKINWYTEGYVTGVRSYPKNCGAASYALAAADMVEALYKKKNPN